ncbi:hypothetical protein BS329_15825 [Amycolatopsis coloradensis]|uniref:Nucleoside diphosphate kinase-like domain-containing protein n=1 Tax=Amycolatopsis coloradensis TaxID=76021 RepID=A0A1R0KUF3_9PSEU|nr:helix-turn-helix domain-containing protein [Amycolatopsis coloradensis]OLZ51730.1 hypothetical protein BS329_15825 [Amycolatopsis coloradensis]
MPRPRVTDQDRRLIQILHDRDGLTFHTIGRRLDRTPKTIEKHYLHDRMDPEFAYHPDNPPPPLERTFVLCTRAAVRRRQVGMILHELDLAGLDLVRCDRAVVTGAALIDRCHPDLLPGHGPPGVGAADAAERSGPVIVSVWEGLDAIAAARNLIGPAFPAYAAPDDHAARRQIRLWFADSLDELHSRRDPALPG